MTDPKCIYANIDGLASMDLPEGHAPEVLCTLTDIGGMVCTGEAGCRFFDAKPDMSALREDVAIAVLHPIRTIVSWCCSNDIDWVERSDGQMVADAAIAAIRAAGYDIVPRK